MKQGIFLFSVVQEVLIEYLSRIKCQVGYDRFIGFYLLYIKNIECFKCGVIINKCEQEFYIFDQVKYNDFLGDMK